MGLREAFRKLGEHIGLDEDEMNELLSDEADRHNAPDSIDFDEPLPGRFGDNGAALEIFLTDAGPALEAKGSDLLWYPMIREGQWAVRPGPQGQKKKKPLKVVAGKSKNQLKEIGLQDLVDAFNDGAVEYVTVPETHDNKVLDNTGFIRGMKIAKAPIQTGPKKGQMAPTLFGGYDFTDKKAKAKVSEGSVAGRSCGILYDYVNTETGKSYPAVIEHVCLTNKPWITGMIPFGRKLAGVEGLSIEPMRFSDDEPSAEVLEDPELLSEWAEREGLRLAKGDVVWDSQQSLNVIREKANEALQVLRKQHREAMRSKVKGNGYLDYSEEYPYWNVRDCSPDAVLIADGYSDGADMYRASWKWNDDGNFELVAFSDWVKVKQVLVEDDTTDTVDTEEVASDTPTVVSDERENTPRAKLALAQEERRQRLQTADDLSQETTHPRGGGKQMKEDTPAGGGSSGGLQLSEEARKQIEAAEARATAAEQRADKLSQTVDRLSGSVVERDTDSYIDGTLKEMGFDEQHGFGGALTELRNIFLADDGGEAVVSDKFSTDGNEEIGLSVTDAFKRFFSAIKTGEDGKIALGQQVTEPSDTGDGSGDGEGDKSTSASTENGKPDPDSNKEELSTDQKISASAAENPEFAKLIGAGSKNSNGDDGGDGK